MSRNVFAVTHVCLYVALSAAFVSSLNKADPDELKQTRHATLPSPPSPPAEPAERSAPSAPEKPALAEARKPALPKADTAKPVAPTLEDLDPFFGLPRAKKTWDLENLTAEQEMELGRQLNEMVLLPRFNQRLKTGSLRAQACRCRRASPDFRLAQGNRLQIHHPRFQCHQCFFPSGWVCLRHAATAGLDQRG